jgi:ABC-type glutathione transport system ATPase component
VVETGLTDQVLDDPQHPYTQLLVSSVLHAMSNHAPPRLDMRGLAKHFTLHLQGGARLQVLAASLDVAAGECVALVGPRAAANRRC